MQTKTDDCHPPKYSEQSSVQKRLIRGTKRGEGHGWYTGGASEVRNGMEGHGWYTGRASAVRNGVRGTVGTPQWVLVYEMYGKKDLYTR